MLTLTGSVSPARAQEEAVELANIYNTAMQAFQQGNWAATAQGLEKFLTLVVDPKQQGALHPIYYTLGAAYFNMENYSKAIEVFEKYLTKYPNAERVLEVKLALAQANLFSNQYAKAIKLFEQLEQLPQYREQSLTAQVQAYKGMRKPDEAIRVLEKLVGEEIHTSAQANAAIDLAEMYANANKPEKAVLLFDKLETKTAIIDNLVALNNVAVKLGDEFSEKQKFREAIRAYRAVRMRDEVLKFQTERINAMERRIADNLKTATGNPQLFVQMTQTNNAIKKALVEARTLLGEFEKLPDFAPILYLRVGKCWYDWDRKWEAIVVYDRILEKYPKAPERETALYSKVMTYADLALPARTQQLCEQYLKEFPQGPNAGIVGYLSGAVALQANDPKSAETYFGTMLERQPDSTYREEMRMLLGNARFMQGKFTEATKDYQKYLEDFPQGQFVEEVGYRLGVAQLFGGDFNAGLATIDGYLAKYPNGNFVPDAEFRRAVCKYGLQKYEEVVADCQTWLGRHAGAEQEAEVNALLGDSLAAQNKLEEAVAAYVQAYKKATLDEVLNYALFEASKHLQKLGKWEEVASLFEEFVRTKPENEAVVAAMYWIGQAKAHQGKVEEAKQFIVETLKKYIDEPKREAVEQLLAQLVQLCAKRPRPAVSPATSPATVPAAVATSGETTGSAPAPLAAASSVSVPAAEPAAGGAATVTAPAAEANAATTTAAAGSSSPSSSSSAVEPAAAPVPTPPPPPYDPFAELEKQLAPLAETTNNTARARLLYAHAEMASQKRQQAQHERIYREIAERFKPDDLSPVLLAVIGDFLFANDEPDRAAVLYTRLKEDFPRSDYLDFAYVGLGEIAFAKKEYPKALDLFTEALDKIAASMKMKEATIGKAKTLLELGRFEESKKLFEQVASIKEWRGESTAFAVYSLGEIEARQNRYPEAIAHFRRVFVAYQKFLPWVAKAYIRAADSFDKMGRRQDAIDNLREMLRNERLQKFPEMQEARKRLEQWGVGSA
jgi:TolA-binding protein